MPLTVQFDVDVCDFRHEPMVGDDGAAASTHARWPGKLVRSVR
jgi:hypothetical protein